MIKTILLPVSLEKTDLAQKAAANTLSLVEHYQAELHIISVTPDFGMPLVASFFPADTLKKANTALAKKLIEYIETYFPGNTHYKAKVAEGKPVNAIIAHADKIKADLIIVPAHDEHSVDTMLMGSTASKLAERAHCSVMVVR